MAQRERTRCKPTGAEHERLRYGLVVWTPEDKPATRAQSIPDDDPWYEKATAGTPEPLDAAGQTGQDTGYQRTERGYQKCLSVIHRQWITLWALASARRRAALPDVTSGSPRSLAAFRDGHGRGAARVAPVEMAATASSGTQRGKGRAPPLWTVGPAGSETMILVKAPTQRGKGRGRQPHRGCLTM